MVLFLEYINLCGIIIRVIGFERVGVKRLVSLFLYFGIIYFLCEFCEL